MDLERILKSCEAVRWKLAFIIFSVLIIWPIIHIIIINNSHLSSWRFFGWGMYATPNPGTQSRLRVVIRDKNLTTEADTKNLLASLAQLSGDPAKESLCINLFLEESPHNLRKVLKKGFCRNSKRAKNLDYFMHFGSPKHLTYFINDVLLEMDQSNLETWAFLTHQRINVFQRKTYLESDIYKSSGAQFQFAGTITSEGAERERQDI